MPKSRFQGWLNKIGEYLSPKNDDDQPAENHEQERLIDPPVPPIATVQDRPITSTSAAKKKSREDKKKKTREGKVLEIATDLGNVFEQFKRPGYYEALVVVEALFKISCYHTNTKVTPVAIWKQYKKSLNQRGFRLKHQHFCKSCGKFLLKDCCSEYEKNNHRKIWIVKNFRIDDRHRALINYPSGPDGIPTIPGGKF
jgi:hypothetical protein